MIWLWFSMSHHLLSILSTLSVFLSGLHHRPNATVYAFCHKAPPESLVYHNRKQSLVPLEQQTLERAMQPWCAHAGRTAKATKSSEFWIDPLPLKGAGP